MAYTGISLELGNTFNLNVDMKPSAELLDEVVVVADANANAGASQNFSTGKITSTPTVDRNVYDIVKTCQWLLRQRMEVSHSPVQTTVTTASKLTVR